MIVVVVVRLPRCWCGGSRGFRHGEESVGSAAGNPNARVSDVYM